MDEPAIRIDSLSKTYAATGVPPKPALNDVSFDVPRGQIFGLLGPNGAGKSTLINILAGLVVKTSGSVDIWGFDIDDHPRNAKRSIGVVPQEIIFDPFFTPRETLEIQAGLYGIAAADRHSDRLLAAMHLTDKANAYSRTLSGGACWSPRRWYIRRRSWCSTNRPPGSMSSFAVNCGITSGSCTRPA